MKSDDKNQESISSLKETQRKIEEIATPSSAKMSGSSRTMFPSARLMRSYFSDYVYPGAKLITDQFNKMMSSTGITLLRYKLQQPTINALKDFSRIMEPSMKSIKAIIANNSYALEALRVPTLDWLRSIDFSPITSIIGSLKINPEVFKRLSELNEIYLQAMYDSKWFPYAGSLLDDDLYNGIMEILATSRGKSKRREKRIDKLILAYYDESRIKKLKKSWQKSDIDKNTKKALCQSLNAFLRGEYMLTVSVKYSHVGTQP